MKEWTAYLYRNGGHYVHSKRILKNIDKFTRQTYKLYGVRIEIFNSISRLDLTGSKFDVLLAIRFPRFKDRYLRAYFTQYSRKIK